MENQFIDRLGQDRALPSGLSNEESALDLKSEDLDLHLSLVIYYYL